MDNHPDQSKHQAPRETAVIRREADSQGTHWSTMHGGYFSDESIARPLLEAVVAAAEEGSPTVLADLGGGTGFLLCQLRQHFGLPDVDLVNVDLSAQQLAQCQFGNVRVLQASAAKVRREELLSADGRLLLMMRSVLHYFGAEGTRRLLTHLRAQMQPGEYFVHQSACFWLGPQRGCFNLLYQRMATGKWYPLVAELEFLLKRAGFEITTVVPGPPLLLDSASLAERYHLTPEQVLAIRDELEREFGTERNVFRPEPEGFKSWLHYHIFTCRAI